MSVTLWNPSLPDAEVNLANTSWAMLNALAQEHGFTRDLDFCGTLTEREALDLAEALGRALGAVLARDNVWEETQGTRCARVIGPNENVAPAVWFGGSRRAQLEHAITVLEAGGTCSYG
jgi:hypothetical protein